MTTATMRQLIAVIGQCCATRGDDDQYRADLIAEAIGLAPDMQRDLIGHFVDEIDRWSKATGQPAEAGSAVHQASMRPADGRAHQPPANPRF